jgi:hypothetical protein
MVSKDLDTVADALEALWLATPAPRPYSNRIQAYTDDLLRQLVDLLRDNIR